MKEVLLEFGVVNYFLDEVEIICFINCVKEGKGEVFFGIVIVCMKYVIVEVVLSDNDMFVSMVVMGVYGGRVLWGSEVVYVLV